MTGSAGPFHPILIRSEQRVTPPFECEADGVNRGLVGNVRVANDELVVEVVKSISMSVLESNG